MLPGSNFWRYVRRSARRTTTLLCLAVVLLAATSCRADIFLDIDVSHTEGGLVTVSVVVDDEVLEWLPDWARQVETSDLVAAGWEVQISSSGEKLSVQKPFSTDAQLAALLAEIGGPDGSANGPANGLFGDSELAVSYDGATSSYSLSLAVNLVHDVADLINPATANLFGGNLFGVPTQELTRRAGQDLNETVGLVVRATVPQGEARLPISGTLRLNEGGTQQLLVTSEFVDDELAEALAAADQASTEATQRTLLVLLWWLALLAAASLGVYLYVKSVRRRRRLARELPRETWMS